MKRIGIAIFLQAVMAGAVFAEDTPPPIVNIPGAGQRNPNRQPGQHPSAPWSGGISYTVKSGIHLNIYGIVDLGVGTQKLADSNTNSPNANPVAATGATHGGVYENYIVSGMSSGSRIGFDGWGQVNENLWAVFVAEQRMEYNSGGNGGAAVDGAITGTGSSLRTWDRQIYGALVSPTWGFFGLGRMYLPHADLISATDLVGGGYTMSMNNQSMPVGINRMSNSFKWISPVWDGFTLRAQYAFGGSSDSPVSPGTNVNPPNTSSNTATNDANNVSRNGDKAYAFGITYETSKFIVGYSILGTYAAVGSGNPSLPASVQNSTAGAPIYINNVPVASVVGYGSAGNVTSLNPAYRSGQAFEDWHSFHLMYDFDVLKASVIYAINNNLVSKNFTTGTWTGSTTPTLGASNAIKDRGNRTALNLAISVPVDRNNKVIGGASFYDDKAQFAQSANQYTGIYEHAFDDKKTTAYVVCSYIQNKNSAVWGFGGGGVGAVDMSTIGGQSGLNLGIGFKYMY